MRAEDKPRKKRKWPWVIGALFVLLFGCAIIATLGTRDEKERAMLTESPEGIPTEIAEPTESQPVMEGDRPTATSEPSHTPEPSETAQRKATAEPTPTKRRPLTRTPTAEPRVMYFCEIDRCKASGGYGLLVDPEGTPVWQNHDPDRGRVLRMAHHHEEVRVIREVRVREARGGLWYELEGGGWTNDFHLTDEPCTLENLEQYTIPDC